ncbi:MAG: DUF1761 domain-containing protein [Pseudomonadota bacterium]
MPFPTFAVWHVFVAAIASFAFGSVWYGTLSKPWMAALGKTREELAAQGSPAVPMVFAILAQIVMAYVLASLLALGAAGAAVTMSGALGLAFTVWLGFVLATLVTNHRFGGASWALTAIDGGHWLGVLLVQAFVLALLA